MRMCGRSKENDMCLQQSQTTIPCGGDINLVAPKKEITEQAHAVCSGGNEEGDVDPDNPDGENFRRTSILS